MVVGVGTGYAGPERPALRYFGGKWRLGAWIISHFPEHLCYVEPFCGGASVLLQKAPARYEVLNDRDLQVIDFFRALRDHGPELIRAIDLTPYSRTEFEAAYDRAGELIEDARRFYVRSWMAHGGPSTAWRSGWRIRKPDQANGSITAEWSNIQHLWQVVARLKNVQFENRDWEEVALHWDHPETLHFWDPPYLPETRSSYRTGRYRHDMGAEEHIRLLRRAQQLQGFRIICGYPSALYDEHLDGWRRVTAKARTDGPNEATECLWLCPRTSEWLDLQVKQREIRRAESLPRVQRSLFDDEVD